MILSWVAMLAVLASGCQRAEPIRTLTGVQRDEIQSRATNHFAQAVMFKPVEGGLEAPLAAQLAPLLIQAILGTNVDQLWADRPAPTNSLPLVFVRTNEVVINTNRYAQFSYVWDYAPARSPATGSASQGVRITLDSHGAPVIWEVRADSTGADVLYVAQSLEVLARAEFGPPPSGRRFAVERAVVSNPTTVVASVIADGPVPMGPVLYLQAGPRDVTALICRCMPAQFDVLLNQQDYQLQATATGIAGFSKVPLDQRLRLPSRF